MPRRRPGAGRLTSTCKNLIGCAAGAAAEAVAFGPEGGLGAVGDTDALRMLARRPNPPVRQPGEGATLDCWDESPVWRW
jgi:hypothetical protein